MQTANESVREVRQSAKLTMEEFGAKLGVSRAAISNVENGNRNLTDQLCKSISREFNVSEDWLRTGNGSKRRPILDDEVGKIVDKYNLDATEELIIREYLGLKEEQRKVFQDYLKKLRQSILDSAAQAPTAADPKQQEIERKVEEYRAELESQAASEKSEASQTGSEDIADEA